MERDPALRSTVVVVDWLDRAPEWEVLVEFRKEDPTVPIQPLHKMSVQDVRSELEPFGFKFQRSLEFLPWQHVIFFSSGK